MNFFLYIDTSADKSSVILFNAEGKLSGRYNESSSNHGKVIQQMIGEILEETGLTLNQLEAICVLNGPGSYTGLRIALATAKGLCYAWQIPLILINKLELMHWISRQSGSDKNRCFIVKARENEYYALICNDLGQVYTEAGLYSRTELEMLCNQFQAEKTGFSHQLTEDFDDFVEIKTSEDSIYTICKHKIVHAEAADLFLSEPFYMKNVHVNKINKL